ncbi:MAG TPA: PAS domain S-box protein [Polyangia bacterium]|jgi:PAS domain S-box-containing protein
MVNVAEGSEWTAELLRTTRALEAEVAERRRTQEALEASEEDLRITLQSLAEAVIATDSSGRISRMNPAAEELTGWSATNAAGRNLTDVYHVIDAGTRQPVAGPLDRVLRDGAVALVGHTLLVCRDGSERAISESGAPIRDAAGRLRGVVIIFRDLTREMTAARALKRGQDRLDQSQARLTALYEAGIIGVVVGTLDGRIIEVNDALLDALGYSRDEILSGRVPWSSLTPAEWREADLRAIGDLRAAGIIALREMEYLHKDGHRVPVMIGSALLAGPENETISFVLDLTQNKQAAAAVAHLRQVSASEAQFRALLEAAPDAVVIATTDGKIALVNGQAENLFGYDRAELIGKPVEILLPERYRAIHPRHRQDYAAAPQVRAMGATRELYGRRKDGTEVPVEVSLSPLQTEQGPLVNSAIRDISERKRSDEQRFRLAAIVESSGDAIIGKTLDGVVTSWNQAAERIFGYAADEIIGKSITTLIPAGREHEEKEILAKLAKGERIEQFDTVRLRKDGSELHVSLTSSPVRDANGHLIGASKIVRDITQRRLAEGALAQAKDQAETASRELEAFSYSVAHDLRAPLRGMNGFAHVLLETYRDKLDAEGQDWLQEIVLNAKKMGELIDALLSLARVTRSELKAERINLSTVAREVIEQLRKLEPDRAVEVHIDENLFAEVDGRLARALLDNLLGNAWKFTGQVPGAHIDFGAQTTAEATTFFVRDDGAGFDMKFASKLFAPFQRLHTNAEFAGTGIGLATAQRIVHRHGGRIWTEGAVGRGATFYFTLPVRAGRRP